MARLRTLEEDCGVETSLTVCLYRGIVVLTSLYARSIVVYLVMHQHLA